MSNLKAKNFNPFLALCFCLKLEQKKPLKKAKRHFRRDKKSKKALFYKTKRRKNTKDKI